MLVERYTLLTWAINIPASTACLLLIKFDIHTGYNIYTTHVIIWIKTSQLLSLLSLSFKSCVNLNKFSIASVMTSLNKAYGLQEFVLSKLFLYENQDNIKCSVHIHSVASFCSTTYPHIFISQHNIFKCLHLKWSEFNLLQFHEESHQGSLRLLLTHLPSYPAAHPLSLEYAAYPQFSTLLLALE